MRPHLPYRPVIVALSLLSPACLLQVQDDAPVVDVDPGPDPKPLTECGGVKLDPVGLGCDGDGPLDPDVCRTAAHNQLEIDIAEHLVLRERTTELSVRILNADGRAAETATLRAGFGAAEEISLDGDGAYSDAAFGYDRSLIEVEIGDEHFAPHDGDSRIERSLLIGAYRPESDYASTAIELDAGAFDAADGSQPGLADGVATVDLKWPDGASVRRVHAGFGDLLGVTPGDDELATFDRTDGAAELRFDVRRFLQEWGGSYSEPHRVGDTLTLSAIVELDPPADAIREQASDELIPEFQPRTYAFCAPSHGSVSPDGDVPSTERDDRMVLSVLLEITLTEATLP